MNDLDVNVHWRRNPPKIKGRGQRRSLSDASLVSSTFRQIELGMFCAESPLSLLPAGEGVLQYIASYLNLPLLPCHCCRWHYGSKVTAAMPPKVFCVQTGQPYFRSPNTTSNPNFSEEFVHLVRPCAVAHNDTGILAVLRGLSSAQFSVGKSSTTSGAFQSYSARLFDPYIQSLVLTDVGLYFDSLTSVSRGHSYLPLDSDMARSLRWEYRDSILDLEYIYSKSATISCFGGFRLKVCFNLEREVEDFLSLLMENIDKYSVKPKAAWL